MGFPKGVAPPRYDKQFKDGAVRLVIEQGRDTKEVAKELGISIDSLRTWLKTEGTSPSQADRSNREQRRIRELEGQVRELKKQVSDKDEVITVLKKSVGILSTP